ncbi:MAG TPA: hypothetical protein VLR89_09190 [Anaerolineaceae bacterium]|nr:hypothetical protein [Anaerolineaceae bacterium]
MLRIPQWIDILNKSLWKRLLIFFGLTLLTVFINGYHFGTFDQVFHIPFLKSWMNPNLYPGDPFVGLRQYYFSFFWYLLMPFYKAGLLEPAMFVIHILITWLTFWALWELCERLFHNPLANVLLSFALVIPHLGFPGFQIIEFSLLNRTFTIPFLLFAILLYLSKRYLPAFILVGLMFNINLVYAGFVMAMFGFDLLFSIKHLPWKKLIPAILAFALIVLPLFIRKNGVSQGFDLTLRPTMVYLESMSMGYNVYYPVGSQPYVWLGTLQGIACLVLISLSLKQRSDNPDDQIIRHFVLASILLIAIGSIASYWLPVTFLVQLQLIRVGVFLLIFAYLYAAGLFAQKILKEISEPIKAWILGLALIFTVIPVIPLFFYWILGFTKQKLLRIIILPLLVIIIFGQIIFAAQGRYLAPGFHIFGPKSDWTDVQLWAKQNTPQDGRFITPPYEYWQYEADWRVFSERATLATIPEIEVLHLNPEYTDGFIERFSMIAPGVLDQLDGNYNHTLANAKKAYLSLSDADFLRIAQDRDCRYLVLPNEKSSSFQKMYSNQSYSIYRFP